jgi:hypothetical protein
VGCEPYQALASDWNGVWRSVDGVLTLKVLKEKEGQIQAAWIDDPKTELELKTVDLSLLKCGEAIFVNTKDPEKPKRKEFIWGRLKRSDKQILIWIPVDSKFETLVQEKKLPGKMDGDSVILGKLEAKHLELLSTEASDLYEWQDPLVLFKEF